MPSKAIKESYSCKRRKDFVTGFAIIFFFLVVCFELYVVIWMPVQLQQKNMLETHTAREKLIRRFDSLRSVCNAMHASGKGFARGERLLVLRVLNIYAIYLRNNAEYMDINEIMELQRTLGRFEALVASWRRGKNCFIKLDFNLAPAMTALEKKNNL
ncbi:MAG: hypothetical protein IKA79_08180 [Lentisphaeria bacterium]|nr:hypothetical protein [Lentisphaeria bacterium]